MDSLRALALLARTPSLKAEPLRDARQRNGSLEAASSIGVNIVPGVHLPPSSPAFLATPDEAAIDADIEWIEANNATLISCTSPEYPQLLVCTSRAPAALYVLGDPNALHTSQLAMVGSRSPTAGGRETAREFAEFFRAPASPSPAVSHSASMPRVMKVR